MKTEDMRYCRCGERQEQWEKEIAENADLRAEVERLNKSAQGYYDEAAKGWTKFRDAEREIAQLKSLLKETLNRGLPREVEVKIEVVTGAREHCQHVWVTMTHCQNCKEYR